MTDVWDHVHAERLALADFLEGLGSQEWDVQSLCAEWAVRDVAAHLAWAPTQPVLEAMTGWVRTGFRVNRVNSENARRWGKQEPAVIVARLREIAPSRQHLPNQSSLDELTKLLCHGLDIRRPLGRPRAIPAEPFRLAADRVATTRWPLSIVFARNPRRTVRGLRMVADDADWSHGAGPEVHGSAEVMLLALTGRPVRRNELTGPGAETLQARLAR